MQRKLISSALVFLLSVCVVKPVFAAGEFSTSYDVAYDISQDGEAQVTEKVTLRNLTDRFYASQFSLTIGASRITDITAFDDSGPLEAKTEPINEESQKEKNKQKITIKFNQQVAGKGKEYRWTLKFKSRDFSQNIGKVWLVSIPKLVPSSDLGDYQLTLSVPVGFGDPTSIVPQPKKESESQRKLNFDFDQDQLLQGGVSAIFGVRQVFEFTENIALVNQGIFPKIFSVPLPPETKNQRVIISFIDPLPENVTRDENGNFLAWFKLNKFESRPVTVKGSVSLDGYPPKTPEMLSKEQNKIYTSAQKYWERDNPLIKAKLSEALKADDLKDIRKKAYSIHRFVVNALNFNQDRIEKGDYERFGGLAALGNPDNALCLEFSDLFVTMARAAQIPARLAIGYSFSDNPYLRPLSYKKDILHCWAEYFDPVLGWQIVDPTWETTSNGVSYFSRFDLNHFALTYRGSSSRDPQLIPNVSVSFTSELPPANPQIFINVEIPKVIYGGISSTGKLIIQNKGNSSYLPSTLSILTSKVKLYDPKKKSTPLKADAIETAIIPPFGHLEYDFELHPDSLADSYNDSLEIKMGSSVVKKEIQIKPFFTLKNFPLLLAFIFTLIWSIYALSLYFFAHLAKKKG